MGNVINNMPSNFNFLERFLIFFLEWVSLECHFNMTAPILWMGILIHDYRAGRQAETSALYDNSGRHFRCRRQCRWNDK